jgi:hypothetical protein
MRARLHTGKQPRDHTINALCRMPLRHSGHPSSCRSAHEREMDALFILLDVVSLFARRK